jgi:hypothetical protein
LTTRGPLSVCVCTDFFLGWYRDGSFRVLILFDSPDIDQNATMSRGDRLE